MAVSRELQSMAWQSENQAFAAGTRWWMGSSKQSNNIMDAVRCGGESRSGTYVYLYVQMRKLPPIFRTEKLGTVQCRYYSVNRERSHHWNSIPITRVRKQA